MSISSQTRRALEIVDACLQRHRIGADDEVLVAFSGGADSAALLWLLGRIPRTRRPVVSALHVDHGLRPDSADAARRACELAGELGAPCAVVRVRCEGPGGVEAAARAARYRALAEAAKGRLVCTAHSADDQAETVLYRLAKGAGLLGMGGIRERAVVDGVELLRPLLEVRREQVEAVVADAGITVVEDPTNRETDFVRNRLRHEVLPALERAIPGATSGLARAARLAQQDEALLARFAARARREVEVEGELDAAGLLAWEPSLASRILRAWIVEAGGKLPSAAQLQRALAIAEKGGEVHLSGSWVLRARGGRLSLHLGSSRE